MAQAIAVVRDRLWHSTTYRIGIPAALGHQGQAVCQCSLGLIRQGTSSKQGKGLFGTDQLDHCMHAGRWVLLCAWHMDHDKHRLATSTWQIVSSDW